MVLEAEEFEPQEEATLLFVVRGDEILLIEKKRGLGAGKINGPGGRLEPGETPMQAAVREVQEEIGVVPVGVEERGCLDFSFADGYRLRCWVFSASSVIGELRESDEAKPLWTPIAKIPYPRMWADDSIWLPLLLDGKDFGGHASFDGDQLLSHSIKAVLCDP